jgi:uracil-DNA glycosylase family 4
MDQIEAPPKKRKKKEVVEVKIPLPVLQGDRLQHLGNQYDIWSTCTKCDLHNFRPQKDFIVYGDGNPDSKVLIVGEAPGEDEEDCGIPFVGKSGKLLNQILAACSDDTGIQDLVKWYAKAPRSKENEAKFHDAVNEWRSHEFFITNVVACRPPENRTPTPHEIETCWPRVWDIIYTLDPWVIFAVGKTALQALLRKKQVEITKYRGQVFDAEYEGRIGKMKYTVIPVYHPSYLLRKADYKVKGGEFDKTMKDFHTAFRIYDRMREQNLGIPIPFRMEP